MSLLGQHAIFQNRAYILSVWHFAIRLCATPFFLVSFLVPRNRFIWVFGAWEGNRYADNSRHVYEYVLRNMPYVTAIWMSANPKVTRQAKDMGGKSFLKNSILGFWYTSRAGVIVCSNGISDVNQYASIGAYSVQLWHGAPIKMIELDNLAPQPENLLGGIKNWIGEFVLRNRFLFPYLNTDWKIINATSEAFQGIMASAFGVDLERVHILGYPRNDGLKDRSRSDGCLSKIGAKGKICILYAPTFRAKFASNLELFNGLEINRLNAILETHDADLFVKLHPIVVANSSFAGVFEKSERIYFVPDTVCDEINDILPSVDILISDYSGALIDFLLLDRPFLLARIDHDNYLKNDRSVYEDIDKALPGASRYNWTDVITSLDQIMRGNDPYLNQRLASRSFFHKYADAFSSQRAALALRGVILGKEYEDDGRNK